MTSQLQSSPTVPRRKRLAVGTGLAILVAAVLGLAVWSVVGVVLEPSPLVTVHTVYPLNGPVPFRNGGFTWQWWTEPRTLPRSTVTVTQPTGGLRFMGVVISRDIQIAVTVLTFTAMVLGLVPKPKSMRRALPVHERWSS